MGIPVWLGVLAASLTAALPVGTGTCAGVRPGAAVITDIGRCSLNFLFAAPDGQRFAGTAGHCALGAGPSSKAEVVWPEGQGPLVGDGSDQRIGEFAYAVFQRPHDFALIRLDRGVKTNPGMCHFGGPTGMNRATTTQPELLRYWGNGVGARDVSPARSALTATLADPDRVMAVGVATPGDSGGGVIDSTGRAVGLVVTSGPQLDTEPATMAGTVGITRLGPQLRKAQAALKLELSLLTATTGG